LAFVDAVHQLDASDGDRRLPEAVEAQRGSDA
jgi:hypothetical protein